MYLSEVYAAGFRCFPTGSPMTLKLRRGLNILVGPNDSGKTAIVDAIRFVLWTRGDEFLRLDPADFHSEPGGERVSELLIRCTFDELGPDEEARFLEWCTNQRGTLRLHVCLRATRRVQAGGGSTVITQFRSGPQGDGLPLEGDLREFLRSTYLRPLRDAERELRAGRRSRLSRILGALPAMAAQAKEAPPEVPRTLTDTMREADTSIEGNTAVRTVQDFVNRSYLDELSFTGDPLSATLGLGSKGSFDQLLERLELFLNPPPNHTERVQRGLGYNNLLFMAAELLLLQSHPDQVPLLLIEEPEAHLHPQHQTLFMQALDARTKPVPADQSGQQVQVLMTTHSPQLAAGADLDAMTMVIGQWVYPLGKGHTKLDDDDYAFLRRFLDATKANLFFARGLIIVEGDAENLLLPAIARKIGRSLNKHGVSLVNVGHRGLFRYSRILQRADGSPFPTPVALIPDRDIPPDAAKKLLGKNRQTESEWNDAKLTRHLATLTRDEGGSVRAFVSEQWTLEFDLARQPALAALVHQAVKLTKGERRKSPDQIAQAAAERVAKWQADPNKTADDVATLIYAPMAKKNGGVSKAEVAERLALIIDELPDDAETFRRKLPTSLVHAIDHATSGGQVAREERAGQEQPEAAE